MAVHRYSEYWGSGSNCYFYGTSGAGRYVNFFNPEDYALSNWKIDQDLKPDLWWFYIDGSGDSDLFLRYGVVPLSFPDDTYELFSYVIEARCYALGAQDGVAGQFAENQINLPSIWGSDPLQHNHSTHFWHSGEFRGNNMKQNKFWSTLYGNDGFGLSQ